MIENQQKTCNAFYNKMEEQVMFDESRSLASLIALLPSPHLTYFLFQQSESSHSVPHLPAYHPSQPNPACGGTEMELLLVMTLIEPIRR